MNHLIIFLEVKSGKEKMELLLQKAKEHFEKRQKLFFLAENENVKKYVDELLWKEPKSSFLPHACDDLSSPLVIVDSLILPSMSRYIFNLTKSALSLEEPFRLVYELDDSSSEEKKNIVKEKFHYYSSKKYEIQSLKTPI